MNRMNVVDAQQLMTADAFWERYGDEHAELIRGEVVEDVPNAEHAKIAALIAMYLLQYAMEHGLGWVRVEAHYYLDEHTLRVPDVSFLTTAREAEIPDKNRYIPFAPDMAVEIISPSETYTITHRKLTDYRAAGTAIMWLVYPDSHMVEVHYLQADRHVRFGPDETLRLESVLPGFALPLANIFVA